MNTISKIIITVISIFIAGIIIGAFSGGHGGRAPGMINLIVFGGLFFGLRAMWKGDKKDKNDKKDDDSFLQ